MSKGGGWSRRLALLDLQRNDVSRDRGQATATAGDRIALKVQRFVHHDEIGARLGRRSETTGEGAGLRGRVERIDLKAGSWRTLKADVRLYMAARASGNRRHAPVEADLHG